MPIKNRPWGKEKGFVPLIVVILLGIILVGTAFALTKKPESQSDQTKPSLRPSPTSPSPTPSLKKIEPSKAPTQVVSSPIPPVSPTSSPRLSPIPPQPSPLPLTASDANSYRDYIFTTYGFTDNAQNFIKSNSSIRVKDLSGTCGGGFWIPWEKTVEINCTQHEATVHELSHAWWHTRRLQNPDDVKGLARDVVRLADGDGSTSAVAFAKGYVYGIGDWKGMYCTRAGCADVKNIKDSDFDLTESTANAKIIDWEIYAGFSSWIMGRFKDGSHALPEYMWKYFEPEFTGSIQITPYYDGGHS